MPKMTCSRWMRLAYKLPDTPEGNDLYDHIDMRTHGVQWSKEKAIGIPASHQHLYDAALKALEAEEVADAQR